MKLGIKTETIKDMNAKIEANKNINSGLIIQTYLKITGKNTAEILLIVQVINIPKS